MTGDQYDTLRASERATVPSRRGHDRRPTEAADLDGGRALRAWRGNCRNCCSSWRNRSVRSE
jgi:hypothetical protein